MRRALSTSSTDLSNHKTTKSFRNASWHSRVRYSGIVSPFYVSVKPGLAQALNFDIFFRPGLLPNAHAAQV